MTFEMPLTLEQQQRAAHSHLEARRRKAAAQAQAVGSPAQPHSAVQNWWDEEDAAWTEALQQMDMPLPAGSALHPGVAAAAGERDEVAALALGQDDDSGRMSQWDASVTEEMMVMAAQVSQAQVGIPSLLPLSRRMPLGSRMPCRAVATATGGGAAAPCVGARDASSPPSPVGGGGVVAPSRPGHSGEHVLQQDGAHAGGHGPTVHGHLRVGHRVDTAPRPGADGNAARPAHTDAIPARVPDVAGRRLRMLDLRLG